MAAAERLTDFASETQKDRQTKSNPGSSNRNKLQKNRQGWPQKSSGCFLCDGPHRYRDCPKKQLLNALATFSDKASPAKPVGPHASTSGGNDSEEDEDNLGAISQWCNTLSHQVVAKKTLPPRVGKTAPALTGSHPEDETQPRNPRKKGLMFVDVKIHGKPIRAMVDTGATHNYLASAEVERLGLVLEKGVGQVKAINSAAQPITGVPKFVLIKVGPFEGKTNLSVVVMDDFKLILGLDFLRDIRTAEASGPIPSVIKKLLKEFEDVMPDELPRKLPPKRAVDHEIKLVSGIKPPARAPYRMLQPELVELRKQLKDMLESGNIKPAKSPYGTPVLF
ncbi:UNVERIFIED_CONTAM: hypothetical protein Slati_2752500 [Sesamum latifolium]|uniref:Gag-asp_proteas domain-containing protein n=1 Tax=Sesamum latifolium TaxID=2727402 RepID=A0AAW2VXQ5_9LAMI